MVPRVFRLPLLLQAEAHAPVNEQTNAPCFESRQVTDAYREGTAMVMARRSLQIAHGTAWHPGGMASGAAAWLFHG